MILTFEEAASAMHATIEHSDNAPRIVTVSTDTRTITTGQTYLALRGEHFDGHAYVEQAVRNGAAAVVVEGAPGTALDVATMIVGDTKAAYMSLAAAARAKFHGRVIAITGSTGKTTTKVLLNQLLETQFGKHAQASPANENNEIGVSKLMLNVSPDVAALVVEMGARHFGDIETLVGIAHPEVGILTNVGEAHLEIMGSRERLAETKWALFSRGAAAVLNVRDMVSFSRATRLQAPPRWFGVGAPMLPGLHANERGVFVADRFTILVVENESVQTYRMHAELPGDYNLENLAAALAGALELGCDPEMLAQAVRGISLPRGRYESVTLPNGLRVIFDAYNASMSGMIATLEAFAQEPGTKRIAVLGSMAELGVESAHMHHTVGKHAAHSKLDFLLVGGEYADDLAAGARSAGFDAARIGRFAGNDEAVEWLKAHAGTGDVVLLKGSRMYKLEQVLQGLRA